MIVTKITGTAFRGRQDTIKELINRGILVKDAIVNLIAEPTCKFDANARRCEINGYTVGYVDREISGILAMLAQRGIFYIGIVEYIGTYNGEVGIRMRLQQLDG